MKQVHSVAPTPFVIGVSENGCARKQHRALFIQQGDSVRTISHKCADTLVRRPELFGRALLFADICYHGNPAINLSCGIRWDVYSPNPTLAGSEKVYLRGELDSLAREDSLHIWTNIRVAFATDDLLDWLPHNLFRWSTDPGGITSAHPNVAEVAAAAAYGGGHVIRDQLELFLCCLQLFIRSL